jgi:hypothetical protein
MLLSILALATPGCAPFVAAAPILAAPSACASLLPEAWRRPVEGAPLPAGDTVGEWEQFADAQTGQLDKANDRTTAAIGIVERCEARDAAAVKAAKRKWWQVFG